MRVRACRPATSARTSTRLISTGRRASGTTICIGSRRTSCAGDGIAIAADSKTASAARRSDLIGIASSINHSIM
jgi:hypothetical protein